MVGVDFAACGAGALLQAVRRAVHRMRTDMMDRACVDDVRKRRVMQVWRANMANPPYLYKFNCTRSEPFSATSTKGF
jgi:hypothetical protein